MKIFNERLNEVMEEKSISSAELCRRTGIPKSAMSQYRSGSFSPKADRIYIIAKALNVSEAWLMGYDVPKERENANILRDKVDWKDDKANKDFDIFSIPGIMPLPKMVKKPRLGTTACGRPILAEENFDDYDDVPEDIKCDFTLLCQGDSMINARIYDGDIVYIREQPQVENGEIAACLVDGEFETNATLKRFYKYDDKIVLQAENPAYPPFVYVNEEMNRVRVIGKAVGFTSKI